MSHPSRYVRPVAPTAGLILQPRDRAILKSVYAHRFIRAGELHALHGGGVSLRVIQVRLRRLWEHEYLDRYHIPIVLDGTGPPRRAAGAPIYALGRAARALLADELGMPPEAIAVGVRHHRLNAFTLEHHLAVTAFLVAVRLAAAAREPPLDVVVEHEHVLWHRIRSSQSVPRYYVVPDGAACIAEPGADGRWYYIEVVRADVRGGNVRLLAKLHRYLALLRAGFFRSVYGHEHLRAVLFVTTSDRRAEHLRALAARLPHGRQLFWFGSYADAGINQLTAATILAPRWRAVDGERVSLLTSGAVPPGHSHPNVCAPS